jgi:26S proteasome regulatory subunit N12
VVSTTDSKYYVCPQEHPEWDVKNGSVFFQKVKESQPCKEIPAAPVITQTLGYARELERIV